MNNAAVNDTKIYELTFEEFATVYDEPTADELAADEPTADELDSDELTAVYTQAGDIYCQAYQAGFHDGYDLGYDIAREEMIKRLLESLNQKKN